MTIQYCSDLHLEFAENKNYLKQNPIKPVGEILLLAGDIVPFKIMEKHCDFFNFVSDNFKYTYWIPGNHEYYYYDAAKRCGTLNEKIRGNVFLVNDISVMHENTKFVFSTLWSKISEAHTWDIEQNMSDFQVIKFDGFRFSSERFNHLHEQSKRFITAELQQANSASTVVVTHHVPTFLNYPAKYKGDLLSQAFAVELFDLIEDKGPAYWIYGHHHYNTATFKIGNTEMLTNQLGYVKFDEHMHFRRNETFRILNV